MRFVFSRESVRCGRISKLIQKQQEGWRVPPSELALPRYSEGD